MKHFLSILLSIFGSKISYIGKEMPSQILSKQSNNLKTGGEIPSKLSVFSDVVYHCLEILT